MPEVEGGGDKLLYLGKGVAGLENPGITNQLAE
jgi:hypothetical protein